MDYISPENLSSLFHIFKLGFKQELIQQFLVDRSLRLVIR